MKILTRLKIISTEIIYVTIAVLSVPSFLIAPLFLLPFLVYRCLLQYMLAPIFNPKAVKIMSLRNSIVANDNLETRPDQAIVITMGLNAELDFQKVLDAMGPGIDRKNDKGEFLYPEFKRYYSSWGGYLFWMEDDSFELTNHVKLYNKSDAIVTHGELKEYCLDLPVKPFDKGRSPWELIMVNKFRHEEAPGKDLSVAIFRVHHGLCDGFSILEFFTSGLQMWEKTKENLPKPVYSSGAIEPSWKHYLGMLLTAPYHSLKQGPGSYDQNAFRIREAKLRKRLRTAHLKYDLAFVKRNSKKWGVTLSGFVYAGISGGFRKFMLDHGMKVPQYFHVGMPFPWPGRDSTKLQNRMCVCVLKFPIGVSDLQNRVKRADELWRNLKRSPAPLMNWTFMPVFGLLPGFLLKTAISNNFTTAVLSNFPGPQEKIQVLDTAQTEDVDFLSGLWRGNCGVGLGLISIHGILKLNIGIDEAILDQEQIDALKGCIEQEFQILSEYSQTDFDV